MSERDYDAEEADAILRRAIELKGSGTSSEVRLSRAELVTAARELGLDDDDVARAEQVEARESLVRAEVEAWHASGRSGLRRAAMFWAVVCGISLGIDVATGPGFWVQWVGAVAGSALAVRAWLYNRGPDRAALRRSVDLRLRQAERRAVAQAQQDRRLESPVELSDAVRTNMRAMLDRVAQDKGPLVPPRALPPRREDEP